MKGERMTKDRFEQTLGALNPVHHVVMAFDSDQVAADARSALLEAGLGDADILVFSSNELEPRLAAHTRAAPDLTDYDQLLGGTR